MIITPNNATQASLQILINMWGRQKAFQRVLIDILYKDDYDRADAVQAQLLKCVNEETELIRTQIQTEFGDVDFSDIFKQG